MPLDRIALRKILRLMASDSRGLTGELRKDIRAERARLKGLDASGGDFYASFWADARAHVLGDADLGESVEIRIAANARRKRLYKLLCDGFLEWWDERRRWTNAPFKIGEKIVKKFEVEEIQILLNIDSILSVLDSSGKNRFVYPYFFEEPVLVDRYARLGLWALVEAFPNVDPDEIRILDVIRGQTYSLDRNPLRGDERAEFIQEFRRISARREELRAEYEF